MVSLNSFDSLRLTRLHLTFKALEPVPLEGFAGSSLRGFFGQALHNSSCFGSSERAFPGPSLYHDVFEPTPALESRNGSSAPFILDPPEDPLEGLETDDLLELGLTLVGRAGAMAPAVLWSLFRYGLSEGITSARVPILLSRADALTPSGRVTVFSGWSGPVPTVWDPDWTWSGAQIIQHLRTGLPMKPSRLALELRTPLDLRVQGNAVQTPTFQDLLLSVLRHTSNHVALHCDGRLELGFAGLKEAADAVQTVIDETVPADLHHHSYRQDRDIPRTALLGRMVFEGALEPFIPLLLLGEVLHFGKGRTMGLGGHRWSGT